MIASALNDFNENRYAYLIDAAKARFGFRRLGDDLTAERIALWRHDIDLSPQRALALARIESEQSVPATYFVLLSSQFYNALEPKIVGLLKEIVALGHDIGLHYDASLPLGDTAAHVERLSFERNVLSTIVEHPVRSFSLHNPTVSPDVNLDGASYAGLFNASAPALRQQFEYCSDSNGVWRFRSLHDVVADPSVRRLYALTHPEWWTPQSMTPWLRFRRLVDGRAQAALTDYEDFLNCHRPGALDAQK
jgi:hypothetical protein